MNLLLDFDGTLIDSKERQYRLFCDLVPECSLSFAQYWEIKRNRVSQSEMLKQLYGFDKGKIARIHEQWLKEIESPARLSSDIPYPGIGELLKILSLKNALVLVTARQVCETVHAQLKSFGWERLFSKVLVTNQSKSKYDVVSNDFVVSSNDIFVGDTGEDVLAGKSLGVRTIAVSYGVLNKNILSEYGADAIADDVASLLQCLKDFGAVLCD